MASLSSTFNVGDGSASSLIKSATTLQNELATYEDDSQKIAFENSGYTDAAFTTYSNYLNSRISTLSSSGTVEDQIKAQTMQQEVVTATHSNISFHIQQDNIQLMSSGISGTAAGYYQKMQVLQGQYQTATSIGDTTLADSLMNQYYSASQSYQSALQTAADSAATLASTNATTEKEVTTNLDGALKTLNDTVKAGGNMNTAITSWVNTNKTTLNALGVVLPQNAAPNYWNIVNGVVGAKYTAYNLLSSMYSSTDPQASLTYSGDATSLFNGETTVSTLAGSLNAQQIAQAEVDPNMFTTNVTTGKMEMNQKTGLQFAGSNQGQFKGSLENTYSGDTTKTVFLSPAQTNQMTKLGLEFTESKSAPKTAQATTVDKSLGIDNPQADKSAGTSTETATNGVTATVTNKSPEWLRNLASQMTGGATGTNASLNLYVDQQIPGGYLEFGHAGAGSDEYYIIGSDGKGLTGGFAVTQGTDGSLNIQSMGGQYGFDQSSVQTTINNALNNRVQLATTQTQGSIKAETMPKLPNIPVVQPVKATVTPATSTPTSVPTTKAVQPTANPQTTAPGSAIQGAKGGLQGGSGSINTGGGGGNSSIKL